MAASSATRALETKRWKLGALDPLDWLAVGVGVTVYALVFMGLWVATTLCLLAFRPVGVDRRIALVLPAAVALVSAASLERISHLSFFIWGWDPPEPFAHVPIALVPVLLLWALPFGYIWHRCLPTNQG